MTRGWRQRPAHVVGRGRAPEHPNEVGRGWPRPRRGVFSPIGVGAAGSLWDAAASRALPSAGALSTSRQPWGPSFLFLKSLCKPASSARGAACAVSAASICFELMHLESKKHSRPPRPHRGPPLLTSVPLPVPFPCLHGLGSHRLPASFFGWVQRKFIVSAAQFLEPLFIQVDSSTLEKTILFFSFFLAPLFEVKKRRRRDLSISQPAAS